MILFNLQDYYPNKCGPIWGNKTCTGAYANMCCGKDTNLVYRGECGTKHGHCGEAFCDPAFGKCYSGSICLWVGSSKKYCSKLTDCCDIHERCGTTEAFCGKDCNIPLEYRMGGPTQTAGGLLWDNYGPCRSTTCGPEGTPCTVRGWCCAGLSCVADPENSSATYKAKKCVKN